MVVLSKSEVEYLRNLGLALAQADRVDGLDGSYIKIIDRVAVEIVVQIDSMIGGIPGVNITYGETSDEAPSQSEAEDQSHMPDPEPKPEETPEPAPVPPDDL
jgi:hypothetical protein